MLAVASREAAEARLASMDCAPPRRLACLRQSLVQYGPGAREKFDVELTRLRKRGVNEAQARYDAFRLVAANRWFERGQEVVRAATAQALDAERAGLGDNTARDVGCGVTGVATGVLALVGSIYTAGVAAPIIGAGGAVVANQIGCGAEQAAAAQAAANANSEAANALTEAANARAAAEAATAERERLEQRKTLITAGLIGGGALLLLGLGYAIIKV